MTALAIMAAFAAGLFVGVLWMLDGQDRAIRHAAAELDRDHPPLTEAEWEQIRETTKPDPVVRRLDVVRPNVAETVLVPLVKPGALRSVPEQREAGE